MNNFPRVPVRYVSTNDELLKGQYAGSTLGGTDYKKTESVPETAMVSQYRIPMDRVNGNEIFRRYPNGMLDIDYAAMKVVDAIHIVVNGGPLNAEQKTALSCLAPDSFGYIDPGMAASVLRSTLRISVLECVEIMDRVSTHLLEEQAYKHSSHAR